MNIRYRKVLETYGWKSDYNDTTDRHGQTKIECEDMKLYNKMKMKKLHRVYRRRKGIELQDDARLDCRTWITMIL